MTALGQQDLSLHFMENVVQSNNTNPARVVDRNIIFSFPGLYFNYGNNVFTYNELIRQRSGNDSTYLDIDGLINNLKDNNILQAQTNVEYFRLQLRFKQLYLTLHHSTKVNIIFDYPKEFVGLSWYGNARYIGEEVEIGPAINATFYTETAVGAAWKFDKLTVGTKLKFLNGIADVSTEKHDLKVFTDDEFYEITVTSDYKVNTSQSSDFVESIKLFPSGGNPGFGIDLGATYQYDDRWMFSASLLDLGWINWKNDVKTYTSNGNFEFSGYEFNSFFEDDTVDLEGQVDSLEEDFFQESEGGSYTSNLTPKMYLSAIHQFDNQIKAGGLFYADFFAGIKPAITLYGSKQFLNILDIGLSYSIKNKTFNNLGATVALGERNVQFFISTDNVVSMFALRDSRNTNFRFGLNLYLGHYQKKKSKKNKDSQESGG